VAFPEIIGVAPLYDVEVKLVTKDELITVDKEVDTIDDNPVDTIEEHTIVVLSPISLNPDKTGILFLTELFGISLLTSDSDLETFSFPFDDFGSL
jgi:hypothetical protein